MISSNPILNTGWTFLLFRIGFINIEGWKVFKNSR